MPFTIVTANKLINKLLRNTDFVPPTTVYVSLHTAYPFEDGSNEVTGGTYVRQTATFTTASNKLTVNTADIEFTLMPTVVVTHIGLWDAETGGNFWWGGELTVSKSLTAGDTLRINDGDLDVTLA